MFSCFLINIEYAIVTSAQPRDKLGDRGSKNDKMPTAVWKKYSSEGRYKMEKESK